jgi:dTDP-4-dehydrorhamnose 3,5-epimerase
MNYRPLPLSGAFVLIPNVHADDRGYFKEIFSAPRYRAAGVHDEFVQDNVSYSKRGVIRGLHADPRMAKLVQVLSGSAFDVMVDLRRESPTYLQWYGHELNAAEHTQLYIPAGFLHGFLALSDDVVFLYKQSATYDPATEFGVVWNDPDLAIDWPLDGLMPQLSPKDASNPTLRELGYV